MSCTMIDESANVKFTNDDLKLVDTRIIWMYFSAFIGCVLYIYIYIFFFFFLQVKSDRTLDCIYNHNDVI